MDFQLICIVLVFLVLFILELVDSKEHFFNPSPFLESGYKQVPYSINYPSKHRDFGNFGTIGSYPANPLCASCGLNRGSITAPYLHANDIGDLAGDNYGKVATKCNDISGKNYYNLNKPFLVEGRSAGRPRQCRRIV